MQVTLNEKIKNFQTPSFTAIQSRPKDEHKGISDEQYRKYSLAFKSYISVPLASTVPFKFEDSMDFFTKHRPVKDGEQPIVPDIYQVKSGKFIFEDRNTLVTAPTGTGKTLIAEYAINNNLAKGKRTFYTAPLKALTNQKYFDFCKLFGKEKVGIMTGDVKRNTNADIVVMTTEIYNNMLSKGGANTQSSALDNLGTVVFDEFHYMDDLQRGITWEESIMFTPKHVQVLPLSATAPNSDKIANWISKIHLERKVGLVDVPPEERHVPLTFYTLDIKNDKKFVPFINADADIKKLAEALDTNNISQRAKKALSDFANVFYAKEKLTPENGIEALKTAFFKDDIHKMPSSELKSKLVNDFGFTEDQVNEFVPFFEDKSSRQLNEKSMIWRACNDDHIYKELIKGLHDQNKLPAIVFKFNRAGCQELTENMGEEGINLLSKDKSKRLEEEIKKYKAQNKIVDPSFNEASLLKGYAAHHSGLLPSYKKFVEEMFNEGLIQVVFATETLAAGINMPAKTTVIADLYKFDGNTERELKPSEFQQMAGRAGRRGMDRTGNVIVLNKHKAESELSYKLATAPADPIKSNYRPTYNSLLNIIDHNENTQNLPEILKKSFYIHEQPELLEESIAKFKNYGEMLETSGMLEKISANKYQLNEQGRIALRIRGTNPIVIAKTLTSKDIEKLTPASFAALFSTIVSEDKPDTTVKITTEGLNYLLFSNTEEALKNAGILEANESLNPDDLKSVRNRIKKAETNAGGDDFKEALQNSTAISLKLARIEAIKVEIPAQMRLFEVISTIKKGIPVENRAYNLSLKLVENHINALRNSTDNSIITTETKSLNSERATLLASLPIGTEKKFNRHYQESHTQVCKIFGNGQDLEAKVSDRLEKLTKKSNKSEAEKNTIELLQNWQKFKRVKDINAELINREKLQSKNAIKEEELKILEKAKADMESYIADEAELKRQHQLILSTKSESKLINLADAKLKELEDKFSRMSVSINKTEYLQREKDKYYRSSQMEQLFKTCRSINAQQHDLLLDKENRITFDPKIGKIIFDWASAKDDELPEVWKKCFAMFSTVDKPVVDKQTDDKKSSQAPKTVFVGDMHKLMNRTVDLLNQIISVAEKEKLRADPSELQKWEQLHETASKAVALVKRPPVGTIGIDDVN